MHEIEKKRVHKRTSTICYACARESQTDQESEKKLEAKLRKEVEKRGGMALKLLSQMHRGLPDRMVLMPQGLQYFVEMKSTGKTPTKLQLHCHKQLRDLGYTVVVIDSTKGLDDFLYIIDIEQIEKKNATK